MSKAIAKRLQGLIERGDRLTDWRGRRKWSTQAQAFLETALGPQESQRFAFLIAEADPDSDGTHALRLGYLEGLIAKLEHSSTLLDTTSSDSEKSVSPLLASTSDSRKVFVVHGHDNETKESTARFLGKLGLEPIILHEQASGGRTIIEKFEMYSEDVCFAVILLTPDDVGATAENPSLLKKRARQNVILELGYFMGRLGRTRVCALHKGGVELPSDYQGVLYVEFDSVGAWKAKLAQEFVQAKISYRFGWSVEGLRQLTSRRLRRLRCLHESMSSQPIRLLAALPISPRS